jgi:hypothetical protein
VAMIVQLNKLISNNTFTNNMHGLTLDYCLSACYLLVLINMCMLKEKALKTNQNIVMDLITNHSQQYIIMNLVANKDHMKFIKAVELMDKKIKTAQQVLRQEELERLERERQEHDEEEEKELKEKKKREEEEKEGLEEGNQSLII